MTIQAEAGKHKAMGRPVGSTRETTLARILPAARKLFATQGYSKTTFKHVGEAVGMTHAALYGYFPSKATLFQATCEHAQALMLAEYAVALQEEKTLRGQIRQILRLSAIAHDRDPSITGLLGSIPLEIRRHPELAELLVDQQNATLQLLTLAFTEAQERGEINDRAEPEELVIAVLGAAVGIGLLQLGLQRSKLQDSMEVFIDLLEGRLFLQTH
jgi:AcrR family transcriptional regulator